MNLITDIRSRKRRDTAVDKAIRAFWDAIRVPSDCGNAGGPLVSWYISPVPDVIVPREATILTFPFIRRLKKELDQ